jgi:hypothetical protein
MLIRLTGILEDGSPRRPGVVLDPRSTISFPKGTSATVEVTVTNPSGVPVVFGVDYTVTLTVKKKPYEQPARIEKVGVLAGNKATFTIDPHDTKMLLPGRYLFDIWLTDPDDNRNAVVSLSSFMLLDSVASIP